MRVKIPGTSGYVDEFIIDVRNFDRRVRAFAGPQILLNDKLSYETKLNSYYRLSKSALKKLTGQKRRDILVLINLEWINYLLSEDDDNEGI